MYEKEYPDVDELVVVMVKSIDEMGAYVKLLEYNNVEGMILMTELSRRRIRSINKLLRVGKQEVVSVLRVDTDRGYIDLSKKAVAEDDVPRTEERYNKAKEVHSIVRNTSDKCGKPMKELYEQVAWPLYAEYGHAYDGFQMAVANPKMLDVFGLDDSAKSTLQDQVRRRLAPKALKFRADVEVFCFGVDGVEAVKAALRAGKAVPEADGEVKIELLASPIYVLRTSSLDKAAGVKILNQSIKLIQEEIAKYDRGEAKVKDGGEPRCVTNYDDVESMVAAAENDDSDEDEDFEEGISGANIAGLS
jgi:translation initiation factor 2 subunit 1|eukprot:COSAG06_NODE_11991_length_1438_cov_1.614638_2_plen_304_part_00